MPPVSRTESDGSDAVTDAAVRARGGDESAARFFVTATQRDVVQLLAHLSHPGVAEDLAQETYERAFRALPRFRAESSARIWLLSIARRVAVDHLRRTRRRPVAVELSGVEETVPAGRERDHSEWVALRGLLSTLSAERREAFVLTQLLGLGYRDAAELVECPVGTIRSRVARARADLVDAIAERDVADAAPRLHVP